MIKTTELLEKLVIASKESCTCEDENFHRMANDVIGTKAISDAVSIEEMLKLLRITTEFSRFSSIRTTCKVLQDLGIIESDVDVLNNDDFRSVLTNMEMFK